MNAPIKTSFERRVFRSASIVIALASLALLPKAQAIVPPPDGGYPGGNTAEGQNALFSLTSGGYNTAVGFLSLRSDITGSFNTAVGAGALLANTGDQNTAVGLAAGLNLTTGSRNICIGSGVLGVTGENDTIRIGDNLGAGAKCFIGGIGAALLQGGLSVVVNPINNQIGLLPSSARFKKDIVSMDKASEAIFSLNPVTFHYKSDSTNRPQFGLIAEDVAEINQGLIVRDKNGEIVSVRYEAVNAMLLNEFLKEHKKVEQLESTVAALAATVTDQAAEIQKVSAQLRIGGSTPQIVANNP
jgi:hypothetical protein